MEPLIWIGVIGVSIVAFREIWSATSAHRKQVSSVPTLERHISVESPPDGPVGTARAGSPDRDGTWVELDVEPLFRSSEQPPTSVIDLIEDARTRQP